MRHGCAFLGGARYPKTVLAEHPRDYGFQIFVDVDGFGKAYKLIEQVANMGVPFIIPNLIWQDGHQFKPEHIKLAHERSKILKPIIEAHKNIDWFINPCTENELNASKFEPFAEAVRSQLKNVQIVNSPNGGGKGHRSSKYLNEFHGTDPRLRGGDGHSWDGANIVDSDVTRIKNMNLVYSTIWNSQCNGNRKVFKDDKERGPKDFKDRAKRIYWPTPKQIDSWIYLYTHGKGATSLPRGWIFKSHADQHDVPPAGKDQKPVWVKLPKFRAIEIRARNGQLIDRAPYFGTFAGGGHRYYHTDWGFTLSEKAKRIQGDGLCDVFADGKKVGTINLAFRDGTFRE